MLMNPYDDKYKLDRLKELLQKKKSVKEEGMTTEEIYEYYRLNAEFDAYEAIADYSVGIHGDNDGLFMRGMNSWWNIVTWVLVILLLFFAITILFI